MENYTDKDFVIDLSETKNTAQLANELNSILESNDAKRKNITLNLGALDLKQSQLLSIKALIESIESTIVAISTDSSMTEASAVSLGIQIKSNIMMKQDNGFKDSISEHIGDLNNQFTTTFDSTNLVDTEVQTSNINTSVDNIVKKQDLDENELLSNPEVQKALDKVLGFDNQQSTEESFVKTNIELIESKSIGKDFEESVTNERSSEGKYVLLDTEGITPDDLEENTENTADLPTLYLTQTLRSGQTVTYEGNIFIVGDAHPGSEVIATGDISVWGILGGIAHAGSNGNINAKVRALKLNPIQLRIAGLYSRRNDTINVPYVQKTNEFTPEEARINNKQIVVYKTLRRED